MILEVVSLVSASRAVTTSCHRAAFSQSVAAEAGRKMMGILMGTPVANEWLGRLKNHYQRYL